MGDAEAVGDELGIIDILAGAAGSGSANSFTMIVKLQRHPDDLGAGSRGERGCDRTVDAAGHGDDDAGLPRRPGKIEADGH
jgi:hypothetical protein